MQLACHELHDKVRDTPPKLRFLAAELSTLFRTHTTEVAVAAVGIAVVAIVQVGELLTAADWPQQWSCHAPVQLGRLEHGRRVVLTCRPDGICVPLPHLAGLNAQLQSGDSISKQRGASWLYVLRDSARYRLTMQWAWNETTREFELAGRTAFIR